MASSVVGATSVTRPVTIQSPALGMVQSACVCAMAGAASPATAAARSRVLMFILLYPDARRRECGQEVQASRG